MKSDLIEYQTRPATEQDYQYCYELTKKNMYDLFCRHWGGWVASAYSDDFDLDATTIITHNSSRVGYFSLKTNQPGLYLDNLQLTRSIQGRGLGTRILQDILALHQFEQVSLTTFIDNPAIHLYRKLGFVTTDSEGATIHMSKYPPHARTNSL